MEIQQMEEFSSAARLGYWPPHLLSSDQDKVYELGVALQEAIERISYLNGVEDENKALQEENDALRHDVERLTDTIKDIRDLTARHVKDVQD